MIKLIRKIAAYTIYLIVYLIFNSIISTFARIGTEHSFTDAFMLFNVVTICVIVGSLIVCVAYKAVEWAHKELD